MNEKQLKISLEALREYRAMIVRKRKLCAYGSAKWSEYDRKLDDINETISATNHP